MEKGLFCDEFKGICICWILVKNMYGIFKGVIEVSLLKGLFRDLWGRVRELIKDGEILRN